MHNVGQIMHSGGRNSVVPDSSCFRDMLEEMNAKRLGAVSIVDGQGRLLGLITDGDVRRLLLKTQVPLPELFMKNVKNIMTPNPKTISADASLHEALLLLERHGFWVIPVVDRDHVLVGMLHMHALLKAMGGS
ncbi:MAG: CBS domain-containing protein [Thermodesulfobacteriota bacterium]